MVFSCLWFGLVAVLLDCGCVRGYDDRPQTECKQRIYWGLSPMYLLHSRHTMVASDGCNFGMDGTQFENYDTQVIQIQSRCRYYEDCSNKEVRDPETWDRIEIEFGSDYGNRRTLMVNSNTKTNITVSDTRPRISLSTYNHSDVEYYINIYFICLRDFCGHTTLWPEFPTTKPGEGGRLPFFTIVLSCFIGTILLVVYFMYRFWQTRHRQRLHGQLTGTDELLMSTPIQQQLSHVSASSPSRMPMANQPPQTGTDPLRTGEPTADIMPPSYDDAIKFQQANNETETRA